MTAGFDVARTGVASVYVDSSGSIYEICADRLDLAVLSDFRLSEKAH